MVDLSLIQEQAEYLRQRGFETVNSAPNEGEPFPYVVLKKPGRFIEQPGIAYFYGRGFFCGCGTAHPSNMSTDDLVRIIEKTVADTMQLDGNLFKTQPSRRFRVFVIDSGWKDVAETLARKYQ